MKMKIKHIAIAFGVFLFFTSCDNFLDVHPKGEVLGKDLLSDQKGFENAMYGVYASLTNDTLYGHNLSYYMTDIMAQYFYVLNNNFAEKLGAYDYKNSAVEGQFYAIWRKMYTNISNVNNILENLEHESPASLKYYNIYKGEALGLRAFMHFDLLRLFSEQITLNAEAGGIPYNTRFSLEAPDILKAKEVYACIIGDLRTSESLLNDEALYQSAEKNDNYLKDQQIHFNLQATQALLARVYLTQGNTDSALYYAQQVIDCPQYSLSQKTELNKDLGGILSAKETIFGLYSKMFNTYTTNELYSYIPNTSMFIRWNIEDIYKQNRKGTDYRWDYWFQFNKGIDIAQRMSKTYDYYVFNNIEHTRPDNQIKGINLIRLPEMYYIAAECLLQKGRYPEALGYFNTLIESRGLTALDKRSPAETLTLERITEDRYKEFIGEGQTFFNMKRLNQDIRNTAKETVPASNKIYVIDIPEQEYDFRK